MSLPDRSVAESSAPASPLDTPQVVADEDAVLGVIEIERPHKCQPGRYVDPEQGVLYANNAPEGTVWRCSCGSLYVHRYVGYLQSRFNGMEWQPATKAQRKAIERGQFGRTLQDEAT